QLLKNMQRVRTMEELCAELYTKEKIRGFLHLYIGEEAVATGVMSLLSTEDNIVGTYREHAHALLKGVSAKAIFAEMFGKFEGCSKGRGGSMHLYSVAHRFFGGSAIVGSGIPQALGLAFAAKNLKENRKTVCFFGEGAMAEGAFHESMNMASLWNIPMLFCCENNFYAMGTALNRSQSQIDLVKKARAYVMEAEVVDGMNIFDVVEKTKQALSYIEREKKPYFLEFKTYRFRAHSMFDPELYRSKNEVDDWKKRDPIEFIKKEITKVMNEDQKKEFFKQWEEVNREIAEEMSDAIAFAEAGRLENIAELNIEGS
ncbi:MAG: pyruvate dehydrogenase (acetyl-transferring) E1 component subunit alpha, partial [Bacteriovorax sp.]|nr:pyruvate dehydrogenase (acetyl-transferring) E1 component subunit alpha [Bacteriovorax sp.]